MGSLVYGILMGVLSLLGLLLASRAQDGMFTVFAFGLTIFGLVQLFFIIRRATA